MTKGKVVLVPFPFDDLSTNKVRPAVCMSDPISSHMHVILAFITSRIPPDLLEVVQSILQIIAVALLFQKSSDWFKKMEEIK